MTQVQDAINQFNKAFKEESEKESLKIPSVVVEDEGAPDRGEFAADNSDRGNFSQNSTNEGSELGGEITPKPKKNRTNAKDRIHQQTRIINETRAANQYLINEIERLKKEKDKLSYQAKQKHDIALTNHEHALKTDKEYSKKLIKEAMENGDSEGLASAQELLAQRTAELATLKIQKSMQPAEDDDYEDNTSYQPAYQQPAYEPYEEAPDVSPDIDDFLEQNPWLDRNSPKFKPELASEFIKIGTELEDRYVLDGRDDVTQSPEFLNYVLTELKNKKMGSNKPIFSNNTSKRNLAMVAPVNRSSGEQPYRTHESTPNEIKLSKNELRMALSIPDAAIPGIERAKTIQERQDLKAYHYWQHKQSSNIADQAL